jgi:hypothetical protein
MNRLEAFDYELSLIKNEDLREFTEHVLERVDIRFFVAPSSSSGEHHPEEDNEVGDCYWTGDSWHIDKFGGLVTHTRKTVALAIDAARRYENINPDDAIVAAILHDVAKSGVEWTSDKTLKYHGELAALWIWGLWEKYRVSYLLEDRIKGICSAIYCHYGKWSPTYAMFYWADKEDVYDNLDLILQEADYYASRKNVSVEL